MIYLKMGIGGEVTDIETLKKNSCFCIIMYFDKDNIGLYICVSVGLWSGEELSSDDAHHHRHGGRSHHQAGLQPRGGRCEPAVWRGALLPERVSRLPQW